MVFGCCIYTRIILNPTHSERHSFHCSPCISLCFLVFQLFHCFKIPILCPHIPSFCIIEMKPQSKPNRRNFSFYLCNNTTTLPERMRAEKKRSKLQERWNERTRKGQINRSCVLIWAMKMKYKFALHTHRFYLFESNQVGFSLERAYNNNSSTHQHQQYQLFSASS